MRPFIDVLHAVLLRGAPWRSAERFVALALADRLRVIDGRAQAWPGVEDLAARTGLSEKTVRRALTTLCGPSGLFDRHRRVNSRGRASDLFVLRPEAVMVTATSAGQVDRNTEPEVSVTATPVPVTVAEVPVTVSTGSGHGDRAIDEPPNESPNEPPREPESVSVAAKPTNGNDNGASKGTDAATRIFETWTATFRRHGEPFTEPRRQSVRSALRHFPEAVVLHAIEGASLLPEELTDRNGNRREDLTDILRFSDKIERLSKFARDAREDAAAFAKRAAQ